ncbi:MAG: AI-2E family transporter [Cellvibrio sp.]|uniref:AI-2E family transporter n=1 Tax=Cellvibrio sp. TaxID=1965322 RepID=UPI0031A6F967
MNSPLIIRTATGRKEGAIALALNILVIIAVLYTMYFCRTLLLPVFVAAFIALFSSPLVRYIARCGVPQAVAAAFVVAFLIFALGASFVLLVEPAAEWLDNLPALGDKLAVQMDVLSTRFNMLRSQMIADADGQNNAVSSALETVFFSAFSVVAGTTAMFLVQVFAVFVITYFFLVYGDNLMRNFVRAQSSFSEKKKAVIIFQTVRDDISHYVLLMFIINIGLGIATFCAMAALGVQDPLLWGALAAILNFAPYVGPLVLTIILTGVGLVEFESLGQAMMIPGAFLILNFIESQFVTPQLLGQRFNLNPLLVVLWMFAWGWVWGVIGLLIAIPLLVCFKILSSQLDLIGAWINILDGDTSNNKIDNASPEV